MKEIIERMPAIDMNMRVVTTRQGALDLIRSWVPHLQTLQDSDQNSNNSQDINDYEKQLSPYGTLNKFNAQL